MPSTRLGATSFAEQGSYRIFLTVAAQTGSSKDSSFIGVASFIEDRSAKASRGNLGSGRPTAGQPPPTYFSCEWPACEEARPFGIQVGRVVVTFPPVACE